MPREVSSKNVLRRIEDTANNIAKDYSNIHLIPRGTPVFLDQGLKGTIRFARRRGNFLPTIAAENSSSLAADISPPSDTLQLSRVVPGMTTLGAVITLGPGRELVRIEDIDPVTGQVTAESEILGIHDAGEGVNLFGVPVEVIGDQPAGDTIIQIRSATPVVIGDQIAIDTTKGLLNSTVSTLINNVTFLGTTIGNLTNYEVTLAEGISRSLLNEEDILLRGQPGYESPSLSVSRVNGPFILDYISGTFFDDTDVSEFLNIQLLNPLGTALAGFEDPVSVGKNFPIVNMTISPESMLFWDLIRGSIQFRGGKFVAVADDQGRFVLSKELVPAFPAGSEWEIPVRSTDSVLLRVKFEPGDFRDVSLTGGFLNRLTVGSAVTDSDSTRIEIVLAGQPNVEVEFSNWLPVSSSLASVVYQITSTAFGDNIWQSGSLMVKPYFFTLDDIKARYDFSAYDSGTVHF